MTIKSFGFTQAFIALGLLIAIAFGVYYLLNTKVPAKTTAIPERYELRELGVISANRTGAANDFLQTCMRWIGSGNDNMVHCIGEAWNLFADKHVVVFDKHAGKVIEQKKTILCNYQTYEVPQSIDLNSELILKNNQNKLDPTFETYKPGTCKLISN